MQYSLTANIDQETQSLIGNVEISDKIPSNILEHRSIVPCFIRDLQTGNLEILNFSLVAHPAVPAEPKSRSYPIWPNYVRINPSIGMVILNEDIPAKVINQGAIVPYLIKRSGQEDFETEGFGLVPRVNVNTKPHESEIN